MQQIGAGRVATVIGRYYAMDRDNRWDRVETAYRLLTESRGTHVATAEEAFQSYYDHPTEPNRAGDEFVEATIVGEPCPVVAGDAVVFFNYRGDRPRELTRAFTFETFPYQEKSKSQKIKKSKNQKVEKSKVQDGEPGLRLGFERGPRIENLYYCTMSEYEAGLPVEVAFARPAKMVNILGAYAADLGLRQFRCAETEKYPHVTFFFNDYRDDAIRRNISSVTPSADISGFWS